MGVTFWRNFASCTLLVPIGAVIGGWPEQSILLNVAVPRPFVPPDGVDEP